MHPSVVLHCYVNSTRTGSSRLAWPHLGTVPAVEMLTQCLGLFEVFHALSIQCPVWEGGCSFRDEKTEAQQDSVTCRRRHSCKTQRPHSGSSGKGSPPPLQCPFQLESQGELITHPPAQQGLQAAWDAGKGTNLSDGPGFHPDSPLAACITWSKSSHLMACLLFR